MKPKLTRAPGGIAVVLCLLSLALNAPLIAAAPPPDSDSAAAPADPLASWSDGPVKQSIINFVMRVVTPGSPDYVAPEARVASFNNDGVLWPERPFIEGIFALERMRALLPKHPEWRDKQPFKAILANDRDYLTRATETDIIRFLRATHSDITELQFDELVDTFFQNGTDPFLEVPYTKLGYLPMRELLDYLKSVGFKNYINTAGDVEFVRSIATRMFGIPPENVIGTTLAYKVDERDGKVFLTRTEKMDTFNNGDNKAINFRLATGRHPLLAVGRVRNGDDIPILRYSDARPGATLQILIEHDDPIREYEYSEAGGESLSAAKKYGWTVVSIRRDWKRVFDYAGR